MDHVNHKDVIIIIDNIVLHSCFWSGYLSGSSLKLAAFPRADLPIGGTFPPVSPHSSASPQTTNDSLRLVFHPLFVRLKMSVIVLATLAAVTLCLFLLARSRHSEKHMQPPGPPGILQRIVIDFRTSFARKSTPNAK